MAPSDFFRGKRVLITAGPTREHIDPVRFLSNASSGRMGLALARELKARGARVFLIRGPGLPAPAGFASSAVVSARDLRRETLKRFKSADLFISAAAVADYRPAKTSARKAAKSRRGLTLRLLPNPDVLETVTRRKGSRFCVGFALQDAGPGAQSKARGKMIRKRCDLMVLNDPAALESGRIRATLLFPDGRARRLGRISKERCAQKICQAIQRETSPRKS